MIALFKMASTCSAEAQAGVLRARRLNVPDIENTSDKLRSGVSCGAFGHQADGNEVTNAY